MHFNIFDTLTDVVRRTPKLLGWGHTEDHEVSHETMVEHEEVGHLHDSPSERVLHSDHELSNSATPDFRALDRQSRWELAHNLSHSLRYV
jgi:hypothetical protein